MEIERLSFSKPWKRESFESEILQNRLATYFAAVSEGGLVQGYAGIWRVVDEGHIMNIAVHPGYRRRGIGRRLLEKLLDYAWSNGIKEVTLEAGTRNDAALTLYRNEGFVIKGIRKQYYGCEDAYVMWLSRDTLGKL